MLSDTLFDPTPIANATAIEGGNVVAPHTQTGQTGKVRRR